MVWDFDFGVRQVEGWREGLGESMSGWFYDKFMEGPVPEDSEILSPYRAKIFSEFGTFAESLTVDDLIRMMSEIEAKWPKEKMPPNPADVHPATFAALRNVCLPGDVSKLIGIPLDAITLHVRTDVEPWKLHPCTCKERT